MCIHILCIMYGLVQEGPIKSKMIFRGNFEQFYKMSGFFVKIHNKLFTVNHHTILIQNIILGNA